MSTVQSLQSLPVPAASAANGKTDKPGSTAEAQNRFLSLLVAQMQNQDPLNPMDNAQLTTQLAQISTVDGIERLNATVKSLMGNFEGLQAVQGATLSGRQVLVEGNTLLLENGSALGGFELDQPVEQLSISIRDTAGRTLQRVDLGPHAAGLHSFEWDGATDGGAAAVNGAYTFKVEARAQDKTLTATPLSSGRVEGVSRGEEGLNLKVRGLGVKGLAAVKQIM